MDNVIFEDPSKPRIRSNRHVAAAPTGLTAFSSRGGTHEIEPQAVTTVYESRPQEHSHTSFGGYSESLSLQERTLTASFYEMGRSGLHEAATGDGRISEVTSLHGDFSLAQVDDDTLAGALDDDLESLFSGIPLDLQYSQFTGSDENPDGRAQAYHSPGAETREYGVISSSSNDLVRSGTPNLRMNADAVDLTTRSNSPQPKLTEAPSPQRCFPPHSHNKARVEVVIPTHHSSSRPQRDSSHTQPANIVGTLNGTRRRTTSPRLDERVEHISGRKRRYRSESDFDSPDSRRVRVEANSNGTPSLFHQTLVEGSAARSRRGETRLHKSGFKSGASIGVGPYDSVHGSDSERTLIDRGAGINCEDEIGPDTPRVELCPTPALNINEPMHSLHDPDQHRDKLKSLSVHPVTSSDAAFITAIVDRPADLQDFFHAPAAWALGCGIQPASLANIALKPLANCCWLLTATVSRCASGTDDLKRGRAGRKARWSPGPDTGSDFCPSEGENDPQPKKRGHWTVDEDNNLTEWRRLGKSWSWICGRFPERSESAVRSRWFVVLAPRAKSSK
ncbi:hypothetical protein LTS17_001901 [Exophiala oligosperma]